MLRATFSSLLHRKLRLLLSALSIVLGVSFVAGAFVLTDSLGASFDKLFSTVSAHLAVDVRGQKTLDASVQSGTGESRKQVPAATLDAIRSVDGVDEAVGNVAGIAQLVDHKGKVVGAAGAPTFGFNWNESRQLSVGHVVAGHAPHGPDEIALNTTLASDAGYQIGDLAPVITDAPVKRYTVVGIIGYPDNQGSLGGSTNVFFDTATAQQIYGRVGTFDDIAVSAKPGVSQGALRARIGKVLPAGTEAVTGKVYTDEQTSAVKKGLSFFSTFLLVFAAIALFVGAFIIFNTFSMLVAQRTRELALLRALGASRGQVTRSVLLEALVVGTLSSLLGLGAGVGVARLLTRAFEQFGATFPGGPTVIAARTVIAAFAVGIVVTSVAAVMPARRASKVPPIAALRDAAAPDRSLARQTIGGAVLLVAGAAAMAGGLTGTGLWLLGVGTLLAFIGIALLSPVISRPVAGLIGLLFTRAVPGRLGRQNALRNPRRTASTAAALMVGLALISAVSVLGASLKTSVAKVVNGAIASDFVLNVTGAGFPDQVLRDVSSVPAVGAVAGVKVDSAKVSGHDAPVSALDASTIGHSVTLVGKRGDLTLRPGTLLMSDKEAKSRHLRIGQRVPVTFAKADRTVTLGGTYGENQLVGAYLFDSSVAKSFASARNVAALVTLRDRADRAAARASLEKAVAGYPNVNVQDRSEFVKQTANQIDQIVSIISILLLFSVVIAILGVVNTLALSVIERTRELGLLRAIGMSRRQLKRMVRVEAVIIAMFGGVLGLVVGSVFGVALQRALSGQGVTELSFPFGRMLLYLVFAALAGVLAAMLPARRGSRLNILDAVATT